MPRVVIIGSGLVGAATALALHRVGIESTLYDQVDPVEVVMKGEVIEFGETGGSVMIQDGGLRVSKCIANGAIVRCISWSKIDGSYPIVSDSRISAKSANDSELELHPPLQILRSTLHSILIKACHKAGIKTLIDKKLVDIKQDEMTVTASFADGSTATGDLLIGADGIHSATRRKAFGDELKAKFAGSTGHVGVTNIKEHGIVLKEAEECAFYTDRENKRTVSVFKVSQDIVAVNVSTFGDTEDYDTSAFYRPSTDLPKDASQLADLLTTWGAPQHVANMVRHSFRLSTYSVYDLPNLENYHKGRVILIGDAAHGMVPNAGIGLLTGLEDVGTLLALFKHFKQEDWNTAFRLYSKSRVARGVAASEQSRSMREKGLAVSPIFGGSLNHFIFRLVIAASNAGFFTLYQVFDCEAEVAKLIQEERE
ncbi:FAD/NAD(P)-binding domain-containing protein [Rhizoclosmatium globosum]|uniref:FAD/NAD(P)-binding domain-containing protein n=1 Tax=Rhizoclosmatium globosum TaxID=329046 RepID=A0A1Y2BU17_9FUNG|nr:FAD/NAD(P)-binding domain-containing protein [Rhizoclosmatium globosum]|eukprot:ORY38252.1 FAD/NAD(P)-binding domain-containing protein [Rhizoclosmatium globosum]